MSVALRGQRGWLVAPALACSLIIGCGDDDESQDNGDSSVVDGGPDGSLSTMDAGLDAAGPDASKPFSARVLRAEFSAVGNDILNGVTFDSDGNIFAVGKTSLAAGATADSAFAVAKYKADGTLDTTFGQQGFVILNVAEGAVNQEAAQAVVVQPGGKIVVLGRAEAKTYAADAGVGALANDTDVVLVRLNANGALDTTFGAQGVARIDVGTGWVRPASTSDAGVMQAESLQAGDAPWSLSVDSDGKLVVHTATAGLEADGGFRKDTDFALLRLSADGQLDTSFGGTGIVRTDFNQTSASVRSATVLANDTIIGAGYSTNSVLAGTDKQNPVLYKVKKDGTPDETFGLTDQVPAPGVWHDFARPDQKNGEAYGAALQGDKFVTLGYGPSPGGTFGSDWVWFRFNADGSQDKTFGTGGATFQDFGAYADNGRALVTLADNRVLGVGTGRPKPATPPEAGKERELPTDGLIGIIEANGAPDTTFGPGGLQGIDLGGTSDTLLSVALSPDKKTVVAVGAGAKATAQDDEDGVVVIFPTP